MVVDLGAGDGRAVLARASVEPSAFVIGIDANAAGMAESSRRAARGRRGSAASNAIFLVEAAEALPGLLAEAASLVTITMPWGSLLRGVLGPDAVALQGAASVVSPGGQVEVLVSVIPADHVDGIATLDRSVETQVAEAWRSVGFELESMRPATVDDLRATRSSWARRLGDRPVWRLDVRRPLAAPLASEGKMGDTNALPKRPSAPIEDRPSAEDLRTWPR